MVWVVLAAIPLLDQIAAAIASMSESARRIV